ncbi:DUF2306 domain-containing protein [Nonomuraea sp. SBT364]|uniref:DUF2306 domain-containing protein n=1 Tax=Nonomuraea sp. SBT364 TaxID=1580530 RepID=UPI00066E68E9|nr:DUF2306 domain-containing protein [Nonomuraea sp. SBT364]
MTDEKTAVRPVRGGGRVAAGLIGLSLVPVVAGGMRMTELAGGSVVMPESAASGTPVPLVTHILCAIAYSVLGAFQFVPRLRRKGWHRRAGRLLVGCGMLAALTGLWMTLLSDRSGDGGLLFGLRVVFGAAMAVSIVLGFAAIRRRDVVRHRAWMIRGYAIGVGAGTQAFTLGVWVGVAGTPGDVARALLVGAGWVINLLVAEWAIRRWRDQPVR